MCCQISVRRKEPGLEEDQEWLILCSTQVRPRSEFPQVPPRCCSIGLAGKARQNTFSTS